MASRLADSNGRLHPSAATEIDDAGSNSIGRSRRRANKGSAGHRNGRTYAEVQGVDVMERVEEEDNSLNESDGSSRDNSNSPVSGSARGSNSGINCSSSRILPRLQDYFLALRPWSLNASFIPVALGAALAFKSSGAISLPVLLVTCLTVLAVHAAGNLVNTYYDYVKGVDRRTRSDDRTLVDHRLTVQQVEHLGVVLYVVGFCGFFSLVYLSKANMVHLAMVFFGGLSCSFLYTGGVGLKYIALGDIIVLIIFGPVSLLFSYFSQTGTLDVITVAYALPLALNTEAILHSNNTRDAENDRKAGAVTMAILLGPTLSHLLYATLLFVPYIIFVVIGLHYSWYFFLPLITIKTAFNLEEQFRSGDLRDVPRATGTLNFYFGVLYLIACCLTKPQDLPLIAVK